MSNLKKYLKVYKEDVKRANAFKQYMEIISENQDFFTRHEVNEFFTDMIKDGTLVYDEGKIGNAFKKMATGVTLASLITFSNLGAFTAKQKAIFDKYENLDSKITMELNDSVHKERINNDELSNDFVKLNNSRINDILNALTMIENDIQNNEGDKQILQKFQNHIPSLKLQIEELKHMAENHKKNEIYESNKEFKKGVDNEFKGIEELNTKITNIEGQLKAALQKSV